MLCDTALFLFQKPAAEGMPKFSGLWRSLSMDYSLICVIPEAAGNVDHAHGYAYDLPTPLYAATTCATAESNRASTYANHKSRAAMTRKLTKLGSVLLYVPQQHAIYCFECSFRRPIASNLQQ